MKNKLKGSPFVNMKAEILDKKPEGLEIAGYDDKDIMLIKAVAIYEGVNANGALFERSDLLRAYETFVGKPLKILFENNNPTGHGYDPNTNTFSDLVKNIGVIYNADAEIVKPDGTVDYVWGVNSDTAQEQGTLQIVVYMGVWQKYYPEIANRLRQLHDTGELAFSIEAERDYEITPEGYRKCFNITFNGLAVVKTPAFNEARSMMVAELLNNEGGTTVNFEQMYNDLLKQHQELASDMKIVTLEKEALETRATTAESKVTELSESIVTLQGDLKSVTTERDTFKSTVEQAEKLKVGGERLEKLKKYGEVTESAEELAELTKEAFVDRLAEAVENFTPSATKQENAENNGVMGVYHNVDGKEKVNRKEALLQFVTGLATKQ